MKKMVLVCILSLFCMGNLLLSSLPQEIVVGYHEDFPPYFYEENGRVIGIFPEMINEAVEVIGIKIKYKEFPWKELVDSAKKGDIDAVIPLFKTKKRMESLIFPINGIALGESYFFTRKNVNINYTGDLHNLKPYTIGIVEGYSYGEEFEDAHYLKKVTCPNDEALLENLMKDRVQVVLGAKRVIEFYARKLGVSDKIIHLKHPSITRVLYVAFSKAKGHQELADRFSGAIEELRIKGKHQEILKKYGCGDYIAFFRELTIGCDNEDYPPYSYWENDQITGVCPEIINKAAEIIGVKVRYKGLKWKDFINHLEKGDIDAVVPLFKTKKRLEFLYYPDNGLVAEKNHFFTLKNSGISYFGDLRDLKGIPIGAVMNYSYGENFDNAEYLTKIFFHSVEALVEKLNKGEVKIGIGNDRVIKYFAKKTGISEKIKFLKPLLPRESLYLAFSKYKGEGYEKLARSFSYAVEELRKDGQYQEILKMHGIEKHTVTLAADNWQPYYGNDVSGYGPIAEIITEAFKRAGYEVKIDFVPWANLLDKVKKGKYDAGFAASYDNERRKKYYFSKLIAKSSPIVFCKKKEADTKGLEDLTPYRIGVVRGSTYYPGFDNAVDLKKIKSNSDEVNIRNLLKGNLDLVIVDKLHVQYLLKNVFSIKERSQIELLDYYPGKKEVRQELHLLISKESEDAEQIRIDFNYGLKQVLKDRTFDRILTKHGVYNEIRKK